jgi:glycosyltransferase involved in cell wall biosynthesis
MEVPLIKNRDFIVFGLQPWDIPIGSNCKNIAAEIAKHNRVLYVNRPLDRISRYKNRNSTQTKNRIGSIKDAKNVLAEISPQLWIFNPRLIVESINFLPPGFLYRFLNKRNNRKLAGHITWATDKLGFKDPVLLIDDDFFNGLYLKDYLRPSLFIYYIRDYLLSQQYFMRHGPAAEPMIIKKADAVAANSKYLAAYAAKYNANAADIGQGCDVEDFLQVPAEVPTDIKGIPSPTVGYCGSLTATRLDIELIHFIARQKPEWNIVLVGPEDEAFRNSVLHQQKNIHFLGSKQAAELPAYTHAFDVCINPQLLNQMTIGNYPRKVDEYLAAGKPVVATKTEAMEMFEKEVYLCNNKEEYLSKIELALQECEDTGRIISRIRMAKSHTWAASVNQLYQLMAKTMQKNGK